MTQHPDNESAEHADSTSASGPTSSRFVVHLAAVAVAFALGLFLLVGAADLLTASPQLCVSCHEMESMAVSWQRSSHAAVACVACHETPRPWYATPQAVVDRSGMLVRDARWSVLGRAETGPGGAGASMRPVEDVSCLQCHDPNRPATSGFRILIDHAVHAESNGSCVSCHANTGHPDAAGVPLSLMIKCFTCHGTKGKPEASAKCGVCHPRGYELRPASHKEVGWQVEHGGISLDDPRQCDLCHTKKSCTDCHRLEMPHPEGWARGQKGHAVFAEKQRATCTRCHDEKPDLCSMCHHKAYDPAKGDWVRQHFLEVRKQGTVFCFGCHSPVYCVECHVR